MHYLSERSGPKLGYILKQDQKEFEESIIEAYFDVARRNDLFPGDVPCIAGDLPFGRPSIWLSAIQYDWTGTEDYYKQLVKGVPEKELEHFCVKLIDDYIETYPRVMNTQYEYIYDDIRSIFDYHRISFIDVMPIPFSYQPEYFLANEPVVQVWGW